MMTPAEQAAEQGTSVRTVYRHRKRKPKPNGRPRAFGAQEFKALWRTHSGDVKAICGATGKSRRTVERHAKALGVWETRQVKRGKASPE